VNSNVKNFAFWAAVLISAFLLWQVVKAGQNEQKIPEVSYSEFLSQVEAGNVINVSISGNVVNGRYRNGNTFRVMTSTSQEVMIEKLREKNVEVWFKNGAGAGWPGFLQNLAPLVLLAALWFFMIRQLKQKTKQSQTSTNYPQ
jgi:cell division protease FtsH